MSAAWRSIRRVSNAFKEFSQKFISWPSGNRINKIMDGFYEMKGFKNVIGAIDGSHLGISGQKFCNENYINRKGFASVIIQAVCDHERRFTDCYVGWPGSVHDSRVFQNSELCKSIESNAFEMFPGDSHLVGDAAYGLSRYMMTPYKDNGYLSPHQIVYNNKQSCTRNIIERAFALFKGKFPRMRFLDIENMVELCCIVLATAYLHNFCVDENLKYGVSEEEFEIIEYEEEVNAFICIGSGSKDAITQCLPCFCM